jgi:hypothetical protein
MSNNQNQVDKKAKYGFNPNQLGRERPNLFVNIKKNQVNNTNNAVISAKINIKMNSRVNTHVYVINNIQGGGTLKYKNDIKAKYTNVNFIEVPNKNTIANIHFNANDVLFVQQLLFTDFVPRDILNLKYKYSIKIIISIHDFCWITDVLNNYPKQPYYHWSYLKQNIKIHPDIIELFAHADLIIHPSYFTYETYRKWFRPDNFIVSYHNDYKVDYSTKRIPPIINRQINIGVMHEYMEYKGSEVISYLVNNIIRYEGYSLNYLIVGKNIGVYQEDEFYEYLKKYNIHFLLLLNKWGETYCYSLTKYINSGLPILYNNIGACKYRIPPNVEHYKKVIENEMEYKNINKVIGEKLNNMLDYVIRENGKYNKENTSNIIHYSPLFENLFNLDERMIDYSKAHAKVKPFCIYFPQFHALAENNKNYYLGMTDITNLQKYLAENENVHNLMTPSKYILNLSEPFNYDLSHSALIQRQVDIAKSFGIYGFAVYYYWFSVNSITKNHLIMDTCFDRFFNGDIILGNNFKIYFIWANEDWSNNAAFNTKEQIYNIYDIENFKSNIKTLIKYFRNVNYYKIDNKPVFYVHHPWLIPKETLYLFNRMLNQECINEGFDGVNLVVNNMRDQYENSYTGLNKYNHNPDYKKDPGTTNYVDHVKENRNKKDVSLSYPASMFFDFNNTARLYIPNKLNSATIISNNTYPAQVENLRVLLSRYKTKREEINKIMLFNSWNEWGENMAVEPSTDKGYAYLNMIKFALLRFM